MYEKNTKNSLMIWTLQKLVIFPGAQFMVAISSSMISAIKPFGDGVVVPTGTPGQWWLWKISNPKDQYLLRATLPKKHRLGVKVAQIIPAAKTSWSRRSNHEGNVSLTGSLSHWSHPQESSRQTSWFDRRAVTIIISKTTKYPHPLHVHDSTVVAPCEGIAGVHLLPCLGLTRT